MSLITSWIVVDRLESDRRAGFGRGGAQATPEAAQAQIESTFSGRLKREPVGRLQCYLWPAVV